MSANIYKISDLCSHFPAIFEYLFCYIRFFFCFDLNYRHFVYKLKTRIPTSLLRSQGASFMLFITLSDGCIPDEQIPSAAVNGSEAEQRYLKPDIMDDFRDGCSEYKSGVFLFV